MKILPCLILRHELFCGLLGVVLLPSPLVRAAGLTVNPSSISNTYSGQITLQITGLTNGETVLIERFLDANGNSSVDPGEALVQSFQLTDGRITSYGGVPNTNIPGDNDGAANGQVQTAIYFSTSPEFARGAGSHLFKLSSPGSRFAPVFQTLTVTQAGFAQRITGQITSGGSTVPYATVALLVQIGQDIQFVAGASSDGSGSFSIAAAAGTSYLVLAASPGFVSDIAASPVVTLNSGQVITTNLSLTAPTRTISGKVSDVVTGTGIPGLQLFIESTTANTIAFAFTDAGGSFTASVLADQWKINLSDFSLVTSGYLRPQMKPRVDTTTASVSGVNVPLARETALIYGSLKDISGGPLPGISFFANDTGNQYEGSALTDASGNYALGVSAGSWYVGPDSQNPALAGYLVQSTNVTLFADQAVRVDFIARRAAAHLKGRVIDTNGGPISDIGIIATDYSGGNNQIQTGTDGSFDLGVSAGTWHLQLESQTAAQRGLVGPDLQFVVTDGVDISNISYVVHYATAQLSGSVTNNAGTALANVFVFASIPLNGTNYNASGQTDATGNYQLGLFNGSWQISLECSGLNQQGYSCPSSKSVTISGANATLNFTVSPLPQLSFLFRHFVNGGDFGSGLTPSTSYPVTVNGYNAAVQVRNEAAYPPPENVLFTGPANSGLTGSAAAVSATNATSAFYFSPKISNPPSGPGGGWTVNYNGAIYNFNVPDPQVSSLLVVPLPTVTVSNNVLKSVSWVYKDKNGNPLANPSPTISNIQVQLFDRDLNLIDASSFVAPGLASYTPAATFPWSGIGRVRMQYIDTLTNRFFVIFSRNTPDLGTSARPSNNQFQFALNGVAGQNYTIQYSTTLTNWANLVITNAPASSFEFIDLNATDNRRFYRVLSGP